MGYAQNFEQTEKYSNQANSLFDEGKFIEAAQMYEKAAEEVKAWTTPEPSILATLLSSAGYCYVKAHLWDEAIRNLEQALEIRRKLGDKRIIARDLEDIGGIYSALGKYKNAKDFFEESRAIRESLGDQNELAITLSELGRIYDRLRLYKKAINCFEQATTILRALGNDKDLTKALQGLGWLHNTLGETDTAIKYLEDSLRISRALGNEREVASILSDIGSVCVRRSEYYEAIRYFEEALNINSYLMDQQAMASNLKEIGGVYHDLVDYDKALDHLKKALAIEEKLNIEKKELFVASTLMSIGLVYNSKASYGNAIEYYEDALIIFREFEPSLGMTKCLNNLGSAYHDMGQYDIALRYYEEALTTDRILGEDEGVGVCLSNIARVLKAQGNFEEALNHLKEALDIGKRFERQDQIARRLHNMASLYDAWGNYDKAMQVYKEAISIFRKQGRQTDVADVLGSLGGLYSILGEDNLAMRHLKESLQIHEKFGKEENIAGNLNDIGVLYGNWGQNRKALDYFQRALSIDRKLGREQGIATCLGNIGFSYAQMGQHEKAINYLQNALTSHTKLGEKAGIAYCLTGIATIYLQLKEYSLAVDHFERSLSIIEKLRETATGSLRRDYLAKEIFTYQALVSSYIRTNDNLMALRISELSRARFLSETISDSRSNMDGLKGEMVQKTLEDSSAVLIYGNTADNFDAFVQMTITRNNIRTKLILKEAYLKSTTARHKNSIESLKKTRRGFKKTGKGNESLLVFGPKQKGELENLINFYRSLLTNPSDNQDAIARELGRELYEFLIEPMSNEIKGKNELTIIPDGVLAFLPFETLIVENGKYLIERFNVKYAPSLTVSQLIKERQYEKYRMPLLAFGGAVYDEVTYEVDMVENDKQLAYLQNKVYSNMERRGSVKEAYNALGVGTWENLPGTLTEVNDIAGIVEGAEIVTGDHVTENIVKELSLNGDLANYRVLHVATHALTLPAMPELSAIVLSQFEEEQAGEDGYLRMGEIAELKLNADFVNLSACETGLGRIYGGEGVVGLTHSFLVAGANSLSVSLWNVADISTSKFMVALYDLVENRGMEYSEAMTAVKRKFINGDFGEKYRHPFYWAPFVYYGN
jgi:tetratricopeptide (TPR) repeat protein